jgi:diguanylate cyclase (GGDEF)-like protein/PAS domain S-box-containing protein
MSTSQPAPTATEPTTTEPTTTKPTATTTSTTSATTQIRRGLQVDVTELLDLSPDFVAVVNDLVELEFVSGGVRTLLGHEPQDWIGKPVLEQIHPDDLPRTLDRLTSIVAGEELGPNELRLAHANGHWVPVELLSRRLRGDDGSFRLVLSIRDVTERQELLRRLTWQAAHDQLTGLLSWTGLQEGFAAESTRWNDNCAMVVRLDIGGFQRVNEFFGHQFGDSLLRAIAQRLEAAVDPGALVGRLGGDDFVIVSPCGRDEMHRAAEMAKILSGPLDLGGVVLENSITIGIARIDVADGLLVGLAEAESALHAAKRTEQSVTVFDAEMRAAGLRRRSLESALRRELVGSELGHGTLFTPTQATDRLTLHYQPVVDAVRRDVIGFEALARWEQHNGSHVPPNEFIPIAEGTGLMVPLGRHLLGVAVGHLSTWRNAAELLGRVVPGLAINVSAAQLYRGEFVEHLSKLLDEFEVPAEQIVVEVTESHVMENLDGATAALRRLRDLGCSVAIDDFGTGYSSFGYLRDLPADIIKIDRSFVEPLATDVRSVHIVRAIVDLSKRLGFTVVAEGVETLTQADMLTALGVDRLQGYVFGHAVPAPLAFDLIGTCPLA